MKYVNYYYDITKQMPAFDKAIFETKNEAIQDAKKYDKDVNTMCQVTETNEYDYNWDELPGEQPDQEMIYCSHPELLED